MNTSLVRLGSCLVALSCLFFFNINKVEAGWFGDNVCCNEGSLGDSIGEALGGGGGDIEDGDDDVVPDTFRDSTGETIEVVDRIDLPDDARIVGSETVNGRTVDIYDDGNGGGGMFGVEQEREGSDSDTPSTPGNGGGSRPTTIFTLQANKTTIYPNEPVSLTYRTSEGVRACSKWSRVTGSNEQSGFTGWSSGSNYFTPERRVSSTHTNNTPGTYTFTMSCEVPTYGAQSTNGYYNPIAYLRQNQTVTVRVIPRPVACTLNASDTTLTVGQPTTLSWNATSTVGEATITNNRDTTSLSIISPQGDGTRVVAPRMTTRYTMTVRNGTSTASCNRLITVRAALASTTLTGEIEPVPPSATISATPCTISIGSSTCPTTVTWNIQNAEDPNVINRTRQVAIGTIPVATAVRHSLTHGTNTIQARDTTTIITSATAVARCATGSDWNGTRCLRATDPYGTLTGDNCIIPVGSGSCTTDLTWRVTNPAAPKLFRSGTPSIQLASIPAGTRSVTLTYNPTTFSLRDTGLTTQISLQGTCAIVRGIQSRWDTTSRTCVLPDSGLQAADCTISNGKSTCQSVMSWDFKNTQGALSIVNQTTDANYFANTQIPRRVTSSRHAIQHGFNTIESFDQAGTRRLDTARPEGICASTAPWNATRGICYDSTNPPCTGPSCPPDPTDPPTITLSATSNLVRSGEEATITWTITPAITGYTCLLNGPGITNRPILTNNGTTQTLAIENKSLFTLTCTGAETVSDEIVIEVVPRVQEV